MAPLAAGEQAQAAALLARAFRDQPLPRAVHGPRPERRQRALEVALGLHLDAVREVAWCTAAREGAALRGVLVAAPPGAWPLPGPPLGARLRAAPRLGLAALRRQAALSEALAARPPPPDHWVLGLLGVDPARARTGVGTALVADWLAQVDAEGASAYLDTDVSGNLRFYARFGFATLQEFRVLGVCVRGLRRPAAGEGR